ncbi:alpha/beta fold hydrolase [Paenibacillus harenae]|uniref:alpha/beta fold hydrolase n=1 Tax=Paenibacillus harenae TaxID=306543 RepID=UPI00278FCF27|nr:alpha/beta hydrolase [Paenibacillus harenae]MDQ0063508.1 pimeloyl-ACP methyl ester carboxylesterase [Paenibacillus harenae]
MGNGAERETISIANAKVELNNGIELAYYDSSVVSAGDAAESGGVIVLLHGYCGSSAYWERVVGPLSRTARIIAPDARGHGLSSASDDEVYSMEMYASDIESLLEKVKVDKACLLGHSLGGYITLAFAEKYGERLSGFGLIHSTAKEDGEAAKLNRDKAAATLQRDGVRPFVDGLIPKLFAPEHAEARQADIERGKQIGYATSLQGAVGTARGMKQRPDRTELIRQSPLPVLLVAGAADALIPAESTFAAAGLRAIQQKLESSGHMGMVEQPEELIAIISRFADMLNV